MTKKFRSKYLKIASALLVLLSLPACSLIIGQTIYENSGSSDSSEDVSSAPEALEMGEDAEGSKPVEASAPSEETYFEQDGIRLYYDPQLVIDVDPPIETISASSGGGYEYAHPSFVHFNLYMEQAQVYVAPLKEYEDMLDIAPGIVADLYRMNDSINNVSDCVPELPLNAFFHVCDHQQFNSNLAGLDFANGSGVRFISVYGIQDMVPVDNKNLVYVFQGITDDSKYYIKAVVRLLHAQLPEVGEIPADVYTAADASTVKQYFLDFEQLLNQNEADFSPKLDWIDAFLHSLRVE